MVDSTAPNYPACLDTLFSEPSFKDQYDPVHLEDSQIAPLLALPLAKTVFGHSDDQASLDCISSGSISYTQYVTEKTKAVVATPLEGLTAEQQKSQLLHIGLAALFAFLQTNVTGPPLEFKSADVIVPQGLRSNPATLRAVRDKVIRELSVDGEAAYKLTPCVELFAVAKAVLVDADVLVENGPLFARTTRMRVNFLHQKMLSEVTGTLQDVLYSDLDMLSKSVLDEQASGQDKGKFLLERATVHVHHGFDGKARTDLEKAAEVRKFEFALTGRLGKRTKFQNRDISQLVILAKSAEDTSSAEKTETTEAQNGDAPAPKKLDLNDDTLLEAISFTKPEEKESQGKAVTVQQESELPPALASLDPGAQPMLDPVDSAILLSFAAAITNTRPEDGLTREETAPYATRVLDGGSSNWQIYTQGLLLRSRIEGYRSRTVERSVLQMQALVDQVLADTATSDTQTTETQQEPSTFLPRPEKDESASASDRLKYIWLLSFSTRWDLESELANRWVNLGGLRTALDIYERLQMWAEVALCYAATDKEDKARVTVRRQLYEPTGSDPDSENEQFEGPELSPLPADAPRLFCILGDIQSDPKMYDRAWEVSNCRYARAQRSLARHFLTLKPPALEPAAEAYKKSLHINRLNHGAWFALGCVQLELHRWDEAIESFTRTVQLEDTDAEAWSNLAAAMLRTSQPAETAEAEAAAEQEAAQAAFQQPTEQPAEQLADDEEPSFEPSKPMIDPYKRKREAIAALHRAAQLKNTDSRIWDNLLTVAASIPPPSTPYRDVIAAQRKVIELLGPKQGEKAIDVPILGMLVDHLVTAYEYETLLIEVPERDESGTETGKINKVVRSGTLPGSILSLLETQIIPLITHSAPLWLLVASVERFRGRPSLALEAHEKAWRATVASATQGAFQMGDEKRWNEVVGATERLVRGGYAKYGPLDKEGSAAAEGEEAEIVAKDWRFKARSAIRGILGKGKEFWEGSEGWERLRELQGEVSGGK
ncbi:tetratricopeptide repeat protein [Aspergillus stella-maris]|uniref:tetratricopeptide repeat protein n=1 Tax=Aspergillus stella-maris TaxID=1810926 RepID=UPI003CCDAFCE